MKWTGRLANILVTSSEDGDLIPNQILSWDGTVTLPNITQP